MGKIIWLTAKHGFVHFAALRSVNSSRTNVNYADNTCHLQAFSTLNSVLVLHFPGTFFFLTAIISTIGQWGLIESLDVLSFHFSQTPASAFLLSLQFCPPGLKLWLCPHSGTKLQSAGRVWCRGEEPLLYPISWCITWNADPVMVMVAAVTKKKKKASLSSSIMAAVGWCMCQFMHFYAEAFDPHWLVDIAPHVDWGNPCLPETSSIVCACQNSCKRC